MGICRYPSWSLTRSRTHVECPRKAFFEYYADGEPEAYHCWNLKELVTLPMLAGEVVDLVIAASLRKVVKGEPFPTGISEVGVRTFERFRNASPRIVESMRIAARTAETRRSSPHKALQSDWYGLDLGEEYAARLREQVRRCLDNFQKSEVTKRVLHAGPASWGPFTRSMRTRPNFELDGHRIYASFDFLFHNGNNIFILDWKSGAESRRAAEEADIQLAVYALYGISRHKKVPENVFVQPVWLQRESGWTPAATSMDQVKGTQDFIRRDIERERLRIEIGDDGWTARKENFPAKPSTSKCTYCKYRQLCSEGQEVCSHIS